MKLILRQIALPPDVPRQYATETAIKRLNSYGIKVNNASVCRISVDSRKKSDIKIVYSVLSDCEKADEKSIRRSWEDVQWIPGHLRLL